MIIIVSGLPRTGTSMMMNILKESGIRILEDQSREANEHNPEGYFEYQPVLELPEGNISWLENAEGQAVKVNSYYIQHLPPKYEYKVLFMERNIEEIVKSQHKTLADEGKKFHKKEIKMMGDYFRTHIKQIKTWISLQPNFSVLYISYSALVSTPGQYPSIIGEFLEYDAEKLNVEKVVDKKLYKEKVK